MLFQPSNIYPSTFSGIGAGTVDVTQGINVSWQVNGDTPMTAYQIKIYQNDSGSTLMYDSGSVSVSPVFEPHDKNGNATYFTAIISAAALSAARIVNGYQYGYKMLITQWWGVSDYVEQTSASVFITRSTPTLAINTITTPVASNSLTITANYSQAQGDPISTVEWVFALAGSESTPIRETGAISTQVLSFDADGLITGNTYSIMCKVVTSTGMEASTGFVQFPVSYSSSSLGINYQLAQLKNSSAVYLSCDDLGSNILAYPYTDTTKTTNGITFTVNGEGDVVATGTATADAYFTIAQGTLSQLGITAGQKFIVTSGYSGAKIVVTETNSSNVVVSTIEGSDPLQYIATSTTNTLKFSIVIPSGASFGTSQQLQPMIAIEDKIVALNDLSVTMQPIQDLHGYSNPWPAGGGKNLLSPEMFIAGNRYINSGNGNPIDPVTGPVWKATDFIFIQPLAGETLTLNHRPYGNVPGIGFYDESETFISGVANNGASAGTSWTFSVPNGAYYIRLSTMQEYLPEIQLERGATATSWEPYENICPISGRTGLSVYRTGKNLVDQSAGNTSSGNWWIGADASNGEPNGSFVLNAGTYTFSVSDTMSGLYIRKNGSNVKVVYNASSATFTLSERTAIRLMLYQNNVTIAYWNTVDIQLELGSTATTYEPYNGSTYAVDWTDEAGTVYHGTVDPVAGQLTVDWAMVDLGTLTYSVWNKNSSRDCYSLTIQDIRPRRDAGDNLPAISSIFVSTNYNATWKPWQMSYTNQSKQVVFMTPHDEYADADAFKAAMSGVQLVYELATPLTYQLTPQEVEALVGTNNVWSTGDSVSVTYTKDTGSQATLSGAIVTFSDSNAVLIPTPQYIPGITGISIYRYLQGESALQHVYDLATGATSILDYYAPSQMQVSYLIVAHSGIGDLFLQTTKFTPTFWFFSILLCDTDSNGEYHVSKEYIFKYGVETGAVSNNNDPTIQKNFTPYPNRQPISSLYKTGKLTSYIGKTNSQNQYSDSVSLQNAIYDISTSPLTKFLKTRKGDILMIDTAAAIQMKTEDNTVQQALKATVDWVEVGEASNKSIVSVPTDSFWPIS